MINKLNNKIDELKYELKELQNENTNLTNKNIYDNLKSSGNKYKENNLLDEIQNEYNNIIKPKKRKQSENSYNCNNNIINIDSDDNNENTDNNNYNKLRINEENHLIKTNSINNVKIKKKNSLIHYSGNITSDGSYIRKGFDGIGGITKLNTTRNNDLRFDKLLMNSNENGNKKVLKNASITNFFS